MGLLNLSGQMNSLSLESYPVVATLKISVLFEEHEVSIPNVRVVSIGSNRVKVIIPTPLSDGVDQPVGLSPALAQEVSLEAVKSFCTFIGAGGHLSDIKYTGSCEYTIPQRVISRLMEMTREVNRRR